MSYLTVYIANNLQKQAVDLKTTLSKARGMAGRRVGGGALSKIFGSRAFGWGLPTLVGGAAGIGEYARDQDLSIAALRGLLTGGIAMPKYWRWVMAGHRGPQRFGPGSELAIRGGLPITGKILLPEMLRMFKNVGRTAEATREIAEASPETARQLKDVMTNLATISEQGKKITKETGGSIGDLISSLEAGVRSGTLGRFGLELSPRALQLAGITGMAGLGGTAGYLGAKALMKTPRTYKEQERKRRRTQAAALALAVGGGLAGYKFTRPAPKV